MHVLAFRHSPLEHLGWISDALDAHGVAYHYIDLYRSPAFQPPVEDAAALIFLGGSMSANDDLPYIEREIGLIRAAIAGGEPVLGVCLGAQLIAKALGVAVYKNAVTEIGWAPLTFAGDAQSDPLFAGLGRSEATFHWHGETFDLPPGAQLLASSSGCRNQAFRWGDRVYGLQFHLETTPEMIAEWCAEDAKCGDKREVTIPIDPHAHAARMRELSQLVFGRWCDLVKRNQWACKASS